MVIVMDIKYIPGTTLPYTDTNTKAFSHIEPLIAAAGGFTLSQILAITGLEGSTIQNWVKRGWVAKTKDKKYNEVQLAQILIINALRGCLQLERIARLMEYINGSAQRRSDDIINESELFNYMCDAVRKIELSGTILYDVIKEAVLEVTNAYHGPAPNSRERLTRALTVMVYACVCGDIKRQTDLLLTEAVGI